MADQATTIFTVSGCFNARDKAGNVIPRTSRTAADLATMCFAAMDVTNYRIDMPGLRPAVDWDNEPAAKALYAVCDAASCVVAYKPRDNQFIIRRA